MAQPYSIPSSPIPSPDDEPRPFRLSTTTTFASTLSDDSSRSAYHIYHKRELHRTISPIIDPSKERRWGPTAKEIKEQRIQRKLEKSSPASPTSTADGNSDGAFYLNTPYLAFHMPPAVLYNGKSRHTGTPLVLIHASACWRKWKLQLGPSIAEPGVIDPRGVVCWRHNGGDKHALKADDRKLKGYKVRTWRLWCEHGKAYVHGIKAMRKAGGGPDPDVFDEDEKSPPARADEVVYLKWTSPLSRHTRRYQFQYAGIDFFWKGTGSVKESRACGWSVKYNHLKLVALVPAIEDGTEGMGKKVEMELCLGKYTSSIAAKKSGTLELFDAPIWRLVSEHIPSALAQVKSELSRGEIGDVEEYEKKRVAAMKKTFLYQVIVATAMCMIQGEKEKREVIKAIVIELISSGSGAGG
ncbi:hypothetical protein K505DRAFT_330491 [Melanomma pulvis-pyrius CBS 109.77]|uniref:Uncharacterized protein n=1 Tax=Melanomma pulvis-pyrius CBS 109.77 TaxID=1314802 RepID=A0A6A6WQ63_9PLEO|nr:hypothetical protein K505DRAFT_330491 [Melanomma pulvis-pyrius CBS 109.77]